MNTMLWIVRAWLVFESFGFLQRLVRDDPRFDYDKAEKSTIRLGLFMALVMFGFILWRLA